MNRRAVVIVFNALIACGTSIVVDDAGMDSGTGDVISDAPDVVSNDVATTDAFDEEVEEAAPQEAGCPAVTHSGSVARSFQIDAIHSGAQPGDQLSLSLCQRWKHAFIGPISYPVAGSGNVFVTVSDQTNADLFALDATTGALAWPPVQLSSAGAWSLPAYDQGRVFAVTQSASALAFDAVTGTKIWQTSLSYSAGSAPTPWNGLLLITTSSLVYALSQKDGSVVWTQTVYADTSSAPTVDDSGVYAGYDCDDAYAFELDGAIRWHRNRLYCTSYYGLTPGLANGIVYTRSLDQQLLSSADGGLLGTYNASYMTVFGSSSIALMQNTNAVFAVSLPAMTPKLWSYSFLGDFVAGNPIVVGANVVAVGVNGSLAVLDLATGAEIATANLAVNVGFMSETQGLARGMAEADGTLFVAAQNALLAY